MGHEGRAAGPKLIEIAEANQLSDKPCHALIDALGVIGDRQAGKILEIVLHTSGNKGEKICASEALDRLGFPSGMTWFKAQFPLSSDDFHRDSFTWEDAIKYFWDKVDEDFRKLIPDEFLKRG